MGFRLLKLPVLALREVLRHADFDTIFRLSTLSTRANGIASYLNFSARYGLKMNFSDNKDGSANDHVIYVYKISDTNWDENNVMRMNFYSCYDHPGKCVFCVEDTNASNEGDNELFIVGEKLTASFQNHRKTKNTSSPNCQILTVDSNGNPFVFEPILNIFYKMGVRQMSFGFTTNDKVAIRKAHAVLQNLSFDFKIVSLQVQEKLGEEMFKYYLHKSRFMKYQNVSGVLPIEREEDSKLGMLYIENGYRFKVKHLEDLKECERVCIKNSTFCYSDVNQILKLWKTGKINLETFDFFLKRDETDYFKLLRDLEYATTIEPSPDGWTRAQPHSLPLLNKKLKYLVIKKDNGGCGFLQVEKLSISFFKINR